MDLTVDNRLAAMQTGSTVSTPTGMNVATRGLSALGRSVLILTILPH